MTDTKTKPDGWVWCHYKTYVEKGQSFLICPVQESEFVNIPVCLVSPALLDEIHEYFSKALENDYDGAVICGSDKIRRLLNKLKEVRG